MFSLYILFRITLAYFRIALQIVRKIGARNSALTNLSLRRISLAEVEAGTDEVQLRRIMPKLIKIKHNSIEIIFYEKIN